MSDYPEEPWKERPEDIAPHFMALFRRLSEATRGLPTHGDKAYRYVEIFLFKFVDHFNSCFHLSGGTPFLGTSQIFYDTSTINVVIRASWETYLAFYYIYVGSSSEEERDCRFWSWWLAGLMDRQAAPLFDVDSVLKMGMEKADIASVRIRLVANSAFQKLAGAQQKGILTGGKWRLDSWKTIGVDAGFSTFLSEQMYGYLCAYAHSGGASLLQLADVTNDPIRARLNMAMLRIPLVVAAHFANDFCDLIDNEAVRLTTQDREFLYPWIKLAALHPKPPVAS